MLSLCCDDGWGGGVIDTKDLERAQTGGLHRVNPMLRRTKTDGGSAGGAESLMEGTDGRVKE